MTIRPLRRSTDETTGDNPEGHFCVLGSGPVAETIARRLHADGHAVTAIGDAADAADHRTVRGDPTDLRQLEAADIDTDSTVIVATPRDERNLLLAQLVQTHFDATDVVVRVNDPDRHDPVAAAGHDPFCVTTVLSAVLVDELTRPAYEHS
ncbi:NAD-binding protein [Haloplanus ruber]|uniref:NAD-binding protein n=1 Tax=Haloplanus ruber TaxID=869892 RepID=A0ABD6CXJ4_9EURY|nr:NAD-binding protein [Haloplanus ruber]